MFFKERKVTFHFEIALDHWDHMLMSLQLLKQKKDIIYCTLFGILNIFIRMENRSLASDYSKS